MKINNFRTLMTVTGLALSALFLAAPANQARAAAITVTTTSDVIDSTDMQCSLREAIISANENPNVGQAGECALGVENATDIIVLEDGAVYDLSIVGAGEDLSLTGDLDVFDDLALVDIQLVVDNQGTATIQGNDIDRILHLHGAALDATGILFQNGFVLALGGNILNEGGVLQLIDSTVSDGDASGGAGIFNNNGSVLLFDSLVRANNAGFNGGGLTSVGAAAYVLSDHSMFVGNDSATGSGGGLSATAGKVILRNDTQFNLNTANSDGGGIQLSSTATLSMTEVTFFINSAQFGSGGGIYLQHEANTTDFYLNSGSFVGNSADGNGGAMAFTTGFIVIRESEFIDNEAGVSGGALSGDEIGALDVLFDENVALGSGAAVAADLIGGAQLTFTDNEAGVDGGAIHADQVLLIDSYFSYNHADAGQGGAIFSENILLWSSDFLWNTAIAGGAIYTGRAYVDQSRFSVNSSIGSGGAISVETVLRVSRTNFFNNYAGFNGGAIFQETNNVAPDPHYIRSSSFLYNDAANDGGAIWTGSEPGLTLANSTVSDNGADLGGGIFVGANATLDAIHVTFWGNSALTLGGGIYKVGDVTFQNTIIDDSANGNCISIASAFITLGNNISSDGTCDLSDPSDQENTDPLLAPFADNGGGMFTHALLPGSPALDYANNIGCTSEHVASIDQRGVWRPINVRCDIGAFESGSMIFLPIVQR
jgi:CSLREA domain-containing protein